MLTGQLIGQLDQTYAHADAVENEMMRQFNCGRMLRILLKTNLVNAQPNIDFPSHKTDPALKVSWAA